MSEYWERYPRSKEDEEFYDIDGFAKGTGATHPARLMKELIDHLAGIAKPVHIRKDYAEEFRAILSKTLPVEVESLLTDNPYIPNDERGLLFTLFFQYQGKQYSAHCRLSWYLFDTVEQFEHARFLLYQSLVRQILHMIQEG